MKMQKKEAMDREVVEAKLDTAVEQVCLLYKFLEEAENNFIEATRAVSQVRLLQAKVTEMEETVTRISTERDEAKRERNEAISARQETAVKAFSFGDEAFKNALEQVTVLNPGIPLRLVEAISVINALGGVLVEYNADKSRTRFGLFPRYQLFLGSGLLSRPVTLLRRSSSNLVFLCTILLFCPGVVRSL